MRIRVLVVDDSGFFRRQITEILQKDLRLEVVGQAANGREAVARVQELRPDVVTMDVDMPEMDGISAVREIMRVQPVPVLMVSALTREGAKATLEALDAGAADFISKNMGGIRGTDAAEQLRTRVNALGRAGLARSIRSPIPNTAPVRPPATTAPVSPPSTSSLVSRPLVDRHSTKVDIVAIGTSTGGPVALQKILSKLPASFPAPILLIQHMPEDFTQPFAERLDSVCKIGVKLAQDGDVVKAGMAYLAPGGKQMRVESRGADHVVHIMESLPGMNYHPSVDFTFESVAQTFNGNVLAIVLTGMGADGRIGAHQIKTQGGAVWAQDEASCVVYGMPMAVVKAGIAERVLPLDEMAEAIQKQV